MLLIMMIFVPLCVAPLPPKSELGFLSLPSVLAFVSGLALERMHDYSPVDFCVVYQLEANLFHLEAFE